MPPRCQPVAQHIHEKHIDDPLSSKVDDGGHVGSILSVANECRQGVFVDQLWLHYAEGSLMLQLLREWSIDRMLPNADNHPGMARLREGTRTHLGMIEDALAGSAFLAGDEFTAADIMMAYPFTTLRRHFRPLDLGPYPAIAAYAARLESRPAFRKASAPVG